MLFFLWPFEFFHLRDFDKCLKWCKLLHETAIFHERNFHICTKTLHIAKFKGERSGFSLLNLTALCAKTKCPKNNGKLADTFTLTLWVKTFS